MAGPVGEDAGKGKGKGRPRDDGGGSVSSPPQGERTPLRGEDRKSSAISFSRSRWAAIWLSTEAPRRKTVCVFAVVVSMMALVKSYLVPPPGAATVPPHLENDLIRLVLAEEVEGVANTLQMEARSFEEFRARRAGALKEIEEIAARLRASVLEVEELEALGKAVHEGNSRDAGLTTEVTRAQESLRDLHRSVTDELGSFQRRLEEQAGTMREIRDGMARVSQLAERREDRIAAAVHMKLESKLDDNLADLKDFYHTVEGHVDSLSPDVMTASDLEALLESAAAQPSERIGTSRDGDGDAAEHQIRALSKVAVDLAIKTRVLGSGSRDGSDESGGGGGCVSEGVVREEVDVAIGKLMADGTGMRDYANAALGGKVLTSKGMVSETYTPSSWWGPSRYWHGAGVENGVGPVESVISEGSSLGACWAMSGSEGLVTIQLPEKITVDGVSVEHVSRMVTTESGSAPKEIEVWGMRNKKDNNPAKLGSAVYDVDGRPIQTFPIEPLGVQFKLIQFKILSNWGNPDYTCLYRLRVHGRERESSPA
ncbi:unnamed protein product [Ectocarpus sp. CCAP 1310/34]|nr:unnamed protein product [Ectocarpus sp. CCAP 1310/34]